VIRKIGLDGLITTVAGKTYHQFWWQVRNFSGDGGPALQAELTYPKNPVLAPDGSIYFVDSGNDCIRKISPAGIITTVAGQGGVYGFGGDGGLATLALLNSPEHLALDAKGGFYVADSSNHRIRHVSADGIITTIAGNGGSSNRGRFNAPPQQVNLYYPDAVAVGPDSSLFSFDEWNQTIQVMRSGIPGVSAAEIVIPSESGRWRSAKLSRVCSAKLSHPLKG